ncbi:MAG: ABC transporter permease [Bacteroidales bacterium]|jgi:ABC-2 type transport system permease protein|nr:ABC transporter permease [Bacteroidales bacterium]
MFKFFSGFRKEALILLRDISGLILVFLMPMVMVIILALVQEFGWNTLTSEPQVQVLFVDLDHDSLGVQIENGFNSSRIFKVIKSVDNVNLTQEKARQLVFEGKYQIAVIIPENVTKRIRNKIQLLVAKTMSALTMPSLDLFKDIFNKDTIEVTLYFDPAVRNSFKNAFISSLKEKNARIESKMVFNTFNNELKRQFPQFRPPDVEYSESVNFNEVYPSGKEHEIIPTSTQHNVPSWAIFAMFFIVIPLTSSIIKEREEGSLIRLLTMPVSYLNLFLAKIGVYLIVCFIQFILMVLVGIYLLPLFGIPAFDPGNQYILLSVMAITSSLAALGYGIMVGTIAKTHQQAAAFGSVSVVILAALGGLWVPTYLMPPIMKHVATFSPLNWAHAGFLDVFLRGSDFMAVSHELVKLFIFFLCTIAIAIVYRKFKPPIGS